LASVRPGDIVRVDKRGRLFHAVVAELRGRELAVRPIERGVSYSSVRAREVVEHWRKTGTPRGRGDAGAGDRARAGRS
jgi:hypothetical protein